MNIDNDLGYKLAMIMITGRPVLRYEGGGIYLRQCLVNIKEYLVPDLDIDVTAERIVKAVNEATITWEAFFARRNKPNVINKTQS